MGKKSGPAPPDPAATAQAQAEANRIDQFGPFGSLVFSGPNRNIATTKLSRDQQAILDLLETGTQQLGNRALGQIGTLPPGEFDLAGLPALPADAEGARAAAEEAVFGRGLRLLDPVFQQQERRLEQKLANQGIPVGSEAFDEDFRSFNVGRDQVLADLADRAVLTGGQESSRLLSNALLTRQQGLDERVLERTQPLNEILTLLGLQQVQSPQSFAPGAVDVIGSQQLAQNAQIANQQARNQFTGGLLGLGGTLGAASILVSSRTFKEHNRPLEPVLAKINSLPVERWQYRADVHNVQRGEHIGTYAEDFQEAFGVGDGRTIHVGDAIGVCMAAIKELAAENRALKARVTMLDDPTATEV